jgi:hypothetical protein
MRMQAERAHGKCHNEEEVAVTARKTENSG